MGFERFSIKHAVHLDSKLKYKAGTGKIHLQMLLMNRISNKERLNCLLDRLAICLRLEFPLSFFGGWQLGIECRLPRALPQCADNLEVERSRENLLRDLG